ncbi:MAG: hypothetical protein WC655_19930 [Candidatus Hydrogenedentales bacterium]
MKIEVDENATADSPLSTSGSERVTSAQVSAIAAAQGAFRAAGVPSEKEVVELYRAISETVIEKAGERGMRLLEKRLLRELCGSEESDQRLSTIRLARTCAALRHIRLADLAASGDELAESFVDDLVELATSTAFSGTGFPYTDLVLRLLDAGKDLTAGRRDRVRGVAVGTTLDLLRQFAALPDDASCTLGIQCASRAAAIVNVILDCHAAGGCSPTGIRQRVADYKDYFGKEVDLSEVSAEPMVIKALAILHPSAQTTEAEQLAAVMGLIVDAAELGCSKDAKGVCAGFDPRTADPRELMDAILQRNITKLVVATSRFVAISSSKETTGSFVRVGRSLGALGAFLTVSPSAREPSQDERAARQDARKKALSSLIDQFGDRTERRGDAIVSVGAALGTQPAGLAYLLDHQSGDPSVVFQATPLSLTVGAAFDYNSASGLGVHVDLSPLDLGGYLAVRNGGASFTPSADSKDPTEQTPNAVQVAPGDAVRPSITFAFSYLLSDANLLVLLGSTVGFAPKLTTDADQLTRRQSAIYLVPVTLSLSIPFVDVN